RDACGPRKVGSADDTTAPLRPITGPRRDLLLIDTGATTAPARSWLWAVVDSGFPSFSVGLSVFWYCTSSCTSNRPSLPLIHFSNHLNSETILTIGPRISGMPWLLPA